MLRSPLFPTPSPLTTGRQRQSGRRVSVRRRPCTWHVTALRGVCVRAVLLGGSRVVPVQPALRGRHGNAGAPVH